MHTVPNQTPLGPASVQGTGAFLGGAPARLLASGMKTNALRTNNLLRKDEWISLDAAIVDQARRVLNGVADLRAAGLTRTLGGLGTLMAEWEQAGSMNPARVDMSATTQSDEDTQDFTLQGVPVPITHKGFRINARRLEASRRSGDALDTTQAELAATIVAEGLEDLLFNGNSLQVQGRTIYGYTTLPARLTGSLSASWATTGDPLADTIAMIDAAYQQHYRGPFMLYVNNSYWTALQDDYKAESDRTVLERLRAIAEIQDVKPASSLASNAVVMVQMTSNVVQLGVAQDIDTVEWEMFGGLEEHFKVLAAIVPILKWDAANQSGIVHYTV